MLFKSSDEKALIGIHPMGETAGAGIEAAETDGSGGEQLGANAIFHPVLKASGQFDKRV